MNVLENSLDLPLREVLAHLQRRFLKQTRYFGIPAVKNPLDFWIYQELLYELQPDVIIEIGNYYGGSTLALAHLCDHLGKGRVIGLDINHANIPAAVRQHQRVTLLEGDACSNFESVKQLLQPGERVLIIEDSSHTYENTLNVLKSYAPLIPIGGYFIVEDGICHHGLEEGPQPGPYEAIETFIAERGDFQIDRSRESFLITWNPKGFLKRIK